MLYNYIRSIYFKLLCFLSTFKTTIVAYFSSVKLGNNVRFYGSTHFLKAKKGTIIIGNNNTFRSRPTSNWIGVNRPCMLSAQDNAIIKIGHNCGFSGTVIGCFNKIIIDDNCRFGANTLITDSDWHPKDPRSGKSKPIHVEKNVWIGEGARIMKGVKIGKNSVIGAGSIVTKDIPANVIAAGNPCKVLKKIN